MLKKYTTEEKIQLLKANRLNKFDESEYGLLQLLMENKEFKSTLQNKKVLLNAHITETTLLQIEIILRTGAFLEISCINGLNSHQDVEEKLASYDIKVIKNKNEIKGRDYDLCLDCCAGSLGANLNPKYGVSELTQSGVSAFKKAKISYPLFSVDDTYIKKIETYFGTSDGFIRAYKKIKNKKVEPKIIIFGLGKVGSGIFNVLKSNKKNIFCVDACKYLVEEKLSEGVQILHESEFSKIQDIMASSDVIITCTGVENLMSRYDKNLMNDKLLINMGASDEWGHKFKNEEVLNNKKSLNFSLEYPTSLKFLDPIFYTQLIGAKNLVNNINFLSLENQIEIIMIWLKKNWFHNNDSDKKNDFLNSLISIFPGNIYWKNKDLRYEGANPSFIEQAGLDSIDDLVGKTDYDLAWTKEESDTYRYHDMLALEGLNISNRVEKQHNSKGDESYVLASKVGIRKEETKAVVGVLGMYQDITDIIVLKDDLEKKVKQLKRRADYYQTHTKNIINTIFEASKLGINEIIKIEGDENLDLKESILKKIIDINQLSEGLKKRKDYSLVDL
tara:strand:- start:560 stop:2239 length:1680 start_codon:yes stop_codon:yes gene_type:complete